MYHKSIIIDPEPPPELSAFDVMTPLLSKNRDEYDDITKDILDLGLFFNLVYNFYINKGFLPSLLKRVVTAIQYAIIVMTLFFMCYKMDYTQTIATGSVVLLDFKYTVYNSTYIFISSVAGLLYVYYSYNFVKNMHTVKRFYNRLLGLYDDDLSNIKWSAVVELIIAAQKKHKFYKLHHSLSNYQIVNHIMRLDNIMIALIHKHKLTTHIFIPCLRCDWPYLPKLYTLCIHFCIVQSIFDDRKQSLLLDDSSCMMVQNLMIQKIVMCSVGILLFSPFIIVILSMYFLFRYFEDFRQNNQTVRFRRWSRYSTWLFRQHNEMYHLLHQRMSIAYIYSDLYLKSFSNGFAILFSRFVAFVCGTILVSLLSASILDEDFLHVHIYKDKTPVWFIGICSIVLAVCRASIPDEYHVFMPEKFMTKIIGYTHYSPDIWKNKFHTTIVKNDFALLFQHRVVYILEELASVILVPYLLYFKVQTEIPQIINFLRANVKKDTRFNLGYIYNSPTETAISTMTSMQNLEKSFDRDVLNILNNN